MSEDTLPTSAEVEEMQRALPGPWNQGRSLYEAGRWQQHRATVAVLAAGTDEEMRRMVYDIAGDCTDVAYSVGQRSREVADCSCDACSDVRSLLALIAAREQAAEARIAEARKAANVKP